MTPPSHLNEAILSALELEKTRLQLEKDENNNTETSNGEIRGDEMVEGAAGAIVEQEHRGGGTEGGEVGVGEEEGGSGESTKSRAGEVEGMVRYVGDA
ncbi:uncharacterized protein MONOS_11466 [Monocercomonoides exilis]|uniref:uncharacterized protein n=1 Tax=Monocercomonoides exilis TaxID=2049356 RepID=UPI0035594397|nr:hypothetical protein MONOS_11466 [Monocercomonoides exilis]|eukprot:MONOS_11466.1-p1 / transcript=MONOS_11466.1 / gene=MONOS_11466 / organism=Monocercomonoides_exilis_PA203 / gene_product=unspecified product / transcript_product=unspecified product / location=Mono_scaffold00577:38066-38504(-) / protein_length=98 / sequence_SO=supercontig / SO=protein_coding / is_pseudo=false